MLVAMADHDHRRKSEKPWSANGFGESHLRVLGTCSSWTNPATPCTPHPHHYHSQYPPYTIHPVSVRKSVCTRMVYARR